MVDEASTGRLHTYQNYTIRLCFKMLRDSLLQSIAAAVNSMSGRKRDQACEDAAVEHEDEAADDCHPEQA